MAERYLQIRNLSTYQHYSKRCPPWIKLHASILDSYDFGHLDDATKWAACGLLLLASRMNNRIPHDPAWVQTRLSMKKPADLDSLIRIGFLEQIASDLLADRTQNGGSETEERQSRDRDRGHATASALAAPQPTKPDVFLTFPTNGNGPKTWDLTREQVAEWSELYEALDVQAECRKALAWVKAKRPKTASGMPKFLVGWLNRASDSAPQRPQEPPTGEITDDTEFARRLARLKGES